MNLGGNFLTEPGNLSQENMELFATLKPADKQHLIETRSLPTPSHGQKGVKVPLSPDANTIIEYDLPDWEPHIWAVRDASR